MSRDIAVVVTTYNASRTLARVLDAHLKQTRPPAELIVADDGSTDDTIDVVESRAKTAPFPIRHVRQDHEGFRAARIRNEAIKAASAGYIVFTDGDCMPHPCFVADHARLAREGCFVQGKRMLVGESATPHFVCSGAGRLLALCLSGQISGWHHLLRVPGFAVKKSGIRGIKTCNLAAFRADLLAINGFNEDYVGWGREDSDLALRLLKYGLKRNDPPFCALVFHLWHEPNTRDALASNDELLRGAMESADYRCENGIAKSDADQLC